MVLAPASLAAQTLLTPLELEPDPPRMRLGPLGLTPSIAITDVGVDTNIYSTADDPQRDYTAKLAPTLVSAIRMRNARLSGKTALGFNYFQKARRYRSLDDVKQDGQFALLWNRLTPRIVGSYGRVRDRPNLEIDARVRQFTQRIGAGADLRVGPRLNVMVGADRARINFEAEQFRGIDLRSVLDRRSEQARTDIRMALTPLTTFVMTADAARDRFDTSRVRNANLGGVTAGFDIKPAALISGTAIVGYRRVDLLDAALPDYSGVVAEVAVNYTLLGRTKFALTGRRRVEYSFEPTEPYYVATGAGLTLTQALGGGWDVRGIGSRDGLVYRRLTSLEIGARRLDRLQMYGAGVGHRVGTDGRIGVDVIHASRHSPERTRGFEGWRVGGSFIYGS